MSQTNAGPPPGWYPDPWVPASSSARRWWDGAQWTPQTDGGQPVPTGTSPQGRPLAGPWVRLAARIIDWLLLFAVITAPMLILGWAMFGDAIRAWIDILDNSALTEQEMSRQSELLWNDNAPQALLWYAAFFLLGLVLPLLYEALLTRWSGQTLGKKLMGIHVVRLADGARLSMGASWARAGLNAILSNTLIDQLWCLWDTPFRQCIHDKPVKSVVVKA